MKIVNRLIDFLVYSNSVIGLAAVGLVFTMANINRSNSVNSKLLLFVFSIVVCVYSWLKYKSGHQDELTATGHRNWFLANKVMAKGWIVFNGALVVALFYMVQPHQRMMVSVLVFFSVFYVFDFRYSIRKLALVKPFYVALIWTLLVVLISSEADIKFDRDVLFIALPLFLLISILLLLFEIKDVEQDRKAKLDTWSVRFGVSNTKLVAYGLSTVMFLITLYSLANLASFGVFLALGVLFAVLMFIIKWTNETQTERWYFLCVDGYLLLLPVIYLLLA